MINNDMRNYEYFLLEDYDEYGQPTQSGQAQGTVQLAIYVLSQSVSDTLLYKDASYIGLTYPTIEIDDTFIIKYGEEKLKVLYTQPRGAFKQVFLQLV